MKTRVRIKATAVRGAMALALSGSLLAGVTSASAAPSSVGPEAAAVLEIELTLTPTGIVHTPSGNAIVRGTVSCSRAAAIYLDGEVTQSNGDDTSNGWGSDEIQCDVDQTLWTLETRYSNHPFSRGLASARLTAYSAEDDASTEAAGTVDLSPCTIVGTTGDDSLSGLRGDDIICGLAGDDLVNGRGGDDKIVGGPGEDSLHGGRGADVVNGGPGVGTNHLDGGPGRDRCKSATARDTKVSCEA